MSTLEAPIIETQPHYKLDHEITLVENLVGLLTTHGENFNPVTVTNLYISLKSKPMAILVGEKSRGKQALIGNFINALTLWNPNQSQVMLGHAWWAERSSNVALFTNAQTQFNVEKICNLIIEANKSGNKNLEYFACLPQISPAEVVGYFAEFAIQMQNGALRSLFGVRMPSLIPIPKNFYSIGTLDATYFRWYDHEMLCKTNVIHLLEVENYSRTENLDISTSSLLDNRNLILSSSIRDDHCAYKKLHRIIRNQPDAMLDLLESENTISEHESTYSPRAVKNEIICYLANAWSKDGVGLFDPSLSRNLGIALDLAISQIMLPRAWKIIQQSNDLRIRLRETLDENFVYSRNLLDQLK